MNYPVDITIWKKVVDKYATKIELRPETGGLYIVFNINLDHDDFYGNGPTNMIIAEYYNIEDKWVNTQGKEISYYDFRNFNANNVGGHDGKITHFIDIRDLSELITELTNGRNKKKNK